ncbi:hypothetical protein OF864_01165 [Bacillus cereus]|nr:hypothetical protein [Bacillus cereus]WHS76005.1 hypothetical protein OF864_01165 [Bacillus cereus]
MSEVKNIISNFSHYSSWLSTLEEINETLWSLPAEKLKNPLTANGVAHCPNIGNTYSLIYVVKEFTDHDNHHKRQIIQFLKENNLG